jgi:hypothetical protein
MRRALRRSCENGLRVASSKRKSRLCVYILGLSQSKDWFRSVTILAYLMQRLVLQLQGIQELP